LVAVDTVAVSVPDTVKLVVVNRAEPGLYCSAVAVWIVLLASATLDDGVNVMYLVDGAVVAMVSTVSDPVACPFIVVHVTVAHVRDPEPVMPLPIKSAGVDGTT
jgi:hypothetical protein